MFDFLDMLERVRTHVGRSPLILAAPYELSDLLRNDLIERGLVRSCVVDRAPAAEASNDAGLAGWWTDAARSNLWLKRCPGATLALLGGREGEAFGGPMLLECWNKGVQRVMTFAHDGMPIQDLDVHAEILRRLAPRATGPHYADIGYDDAFDALFAAVGDRLRMRDEEVNRGRILLLSGSLQPGGSERQQAYTAIGLAQRGYDVVVGVNYLDPPRDFFKAELEAAGVKVELVPYLDNTFDEPLAVSVREALSSFDLFRMNWGLFYEIWHYAKLIRKVGPAVVHTWMDYTNVLGGVAADLCGVTGLVQSGRSLSPEVFPNLFQPYMRPGYQAILSRRRPAFINNSQAGARHYERWLHLAPNTIGVVHNGFNFPTPDPADRDRVRQDHGLASDAIVVGTIARFTEEKNLRLFVDAAKILSDTHPHVRFIAFGDGPQRQALVEGVARDGLSDVIRLPGLTPSPWPALAAMDILALTSRVEGLANVLVEAQAAGRPVVCTAVGGMPETYIEGETGFGVPEATQQAIAAQLAKLVDDPDLRRRAGAAGADYVRNTFSLDAMIAGTLEAYGRVGYAVKPPPPPEPEDRAVGSIQSASELLDEAVKVNLHDDTPPWNFVTRPLAELEAAAEYAMAQADHALRHMRDVGLGPEGVTRLELGPGSDFGAHLILADHGVRSILADRFLSPFDPAFHPALYRLMAERGAPSKSLLKAVEQGGYEGLLTLVPEPAEALESVPSSSCDVVASNAVLEHVYDPAAVAAELARVTRPNGFGFHQIDLGDHHNRSAPLSLLLDDDQDFATEYAHVYGQRGNRFRLSEHLAAFAASGFHALQIHEDGRVDDAYLNAFLPRLRAAASSYRDWPAEDLPVLGAFVVLRLISDADEAERGRLNLAHHVKIKAAAYPLT